MTSQSFANLWDAIEKTPGAVAAMKMRSTLLTAILRGKIDKFSLDMLVRIAAKADPKVRTQISSGTKAA